MNSPTVILEAESKHYESVAAIYNEAILKGTATMEESLKTAEDIAGWIKKFNHRERLYVMIRSDIIIGWGIIKRYSDREGYRFACETAVYFWERETGKGYGSQMKKYLQVKCAELDYHHLVAKIFATNTASIEYNKRLGYEIVGRQREVGFKNGRRIDIVIMQCIIENT